MFEQNEFDNFDPDLFDADTFNSYDPNNATGDAVQKAERTRTVNKTQINLNITNTAAVALKVELFSALDSILTRKKPEYTTGNFLYVPITSYEGQAIADANKYGTCGADQDGAVIIKGGAGEGTVKIQCNEYPYLSLIESSRLRAFQVTRLRLTVATDAQIDNNITHFIQTMGGGKKENTISPRAYFKPNQFQGKTLDIDQAFTIDARSGLLLTLNANESIRLSLFINA